MRRRAVYLFCIVSAIMFGALREFLLINLNYQIDHVARHTGISFAHSLFQSWVRGYDLRTLILLKWAMAVLFIVAMWALCLLLAHVLFPPRQVDRPITLAFVGIAGLALLLHALARWEPPLETVSVKLLHALQYPVLLFFLWASALLRSGVRTGST